MGSCWTLWFTYGRACSINSGNNQQKYRASIDMESLQQKDSAQRETNLIPDKLFDSR